MVPRESLTLEANSFLLNRGLVFQQVKYVMTKIPLKRIGIGSSLISSRWKCKDKCFNEGNRGDFEDQRVSILNVLKELRKNKMSFRFRTIDESKYLGYPIDYKNSVMNI